MSFVLWLTGLSGSGKTTIGKMVENELSKAGHVVNFLDGDVIRKNISKNLGFSREDIIKNNHRSILISKILAEQGEIVIVSIISPFQKTRDFAREKIKNYFEVFLDCPLEDCMRRDSKGIYKKALSGEIENFIGIHIPYEKPKNSDIIIDTTKEKSEESVKKIMQKLKEVGYI